MKRQKVQLQKIPQMVTLHYKLKMHRIFGNYLLFGLIGCIFSIRYNKYYLVFGYSEKLIFGASLL